MTRALKLAALILNILVLLGLMIYFLWDPSCCGPATLYFASSMFIALPSLLNIIAIWHASRKPGTKTSSKAPQRNDVSRTLAMAVNAIYLLLMIKVIYDERFSTALGLLAVLYILSFYVLWKNWRASRQSSVGLVEAEN